MATILQEHHDDEVGGRTAFCTPNNTTAADNSNTARSAAVSVLPSDTMGALQDHGDSKDTSRPGDENPRAVDGNDDEDSVTMVCMICWAYDKKISEDQDTNHQAQYDDVAEGGDNGKKLLFRTLTCGHSGCHGCIKEWIERCESCGLDLATCPHCRQPITESDVHAFLGGRPYQRISQDPATNTDEANLVLVPDDLTQDWLDTNDTHQCTNCGMYTIRDDADEADQVPLAACGLCGHIYCWVCQQDYEDCDDDDDDYYDDGHDHDEFYDPKSQILFPTRDANKFPIAAQDDIQGGGDRMENFLARREAAIDSYQRDRYEQIEPASYVFLTSVFDECTESAGYVFLTSVFDECTEPADYIRQPSLFP